MDGINQYAQLALPTRYYAMTKDWASLDRLQEGEQGIFYNEYYPEHILIRRLPGTLEPSLHWKFKIEMEHKCPAAFVAVLPGGRLWGRNGVVISPDNRLLADVSIEFNKEAKDHSIFKEKSIRFPDFTTDTVGVLASIASWNYFHWMFDMLPRFHLLTQNGIAIDQFAVYLDGHSFQMETLNKLGLSQRLLLLTDQTHLISSNLVVPSLPGDTGHMPKWACEFLRREFLGADAESMAGYERIYISRQYAFSRRITNDSEVVALLAARGFRPVVLEALPVVEQARIFASAKVIVAPHGAGLTNLVFCNPGTKVIEIFSPNYVNILFWGLSNHMELDYYYLLGMGEQPEEYIDPHLVGDNITVDIGSLQALVNLAEE